MSESDTSERENIFYEVKNFAGRVEKFYENREFFWQESQSTLSKWLWKFLGLFSLKNEEVELNDGEKFISEIIGELDATYRAIKDFEFALLDLQEIIIDQFSNISMRVGNFWLKFN